MATATTIEWTDTTWNPVRGCSIVSPGCHNCYAMKQGHRFSRPGGTYEGLTKMTRFGARWTGKVKTIDALLLQPLQWRRAQRIFVNSMSDLFHEAVPFEFIDQVFAVMALAPRHTFQILTKRPRRMRDYMATLTGSVNRMDDLGMDAAGIADAMESVPLGDLASKVGEVWPLPNVWLGVSVEDQQRADERIPLLLQTPAAVRFISAEPLLGAVDLRLNFRFDATNMMSDLVRERLHWVIVGGESGPGARPFDIAWARSIVSQCAAAGVACFVKQLGADPRDAAAERDDMCARETWPAGWMPEVDGRKVWRPDLTDRKGGDPVEWPADLRVRDFPGPRS